MLRTFQAKLDIMEKVLAGKLEDFPIGTQKIVELEDDYDGNDDDEDDRPGRPFDEK